MGVLSEKLKNIITAYKSNRNIIKDEINPFAVKNVNDDELNALMNAFGYFTNKLDDSFKQTTEKMRRIGTLNAIYANYLNTYDIERHFNYLLIALINKNFFSYDRAAIFLRDKTMNAYTCKYAAGANTRDEIIAKFENKDAYYKFNPEIRESFELYTKLPYFGCEFEKTALGISFPFNEVMETLAANFEKFGKIIKMPTDLIVENKIMKVVRESFKSKEYIIYGMFINGELFGFIFFDNIITNIQISNTAVKNAEILLDGFVYIVEQFIVKPYQISELKVSEAMENITVIEKNKSNKIIKNIFN